MPFGILFIPLLPVLMMILGVTGGRRLSLRYLVAIGGLAAIAVVLCVSRKAMKKAAQTVSVSPEPSSARNDSAAAAFAPAD